MFDLDATGSSLPSSTRISTRDLLVDIGFEPVIATFTDLQPGYRYDFGNFVLHASQVTSRYLRPEIFFTGTIVTPRSINAVGASRLVVFALRVAQICRKFSGFFCSVLFPVRLQFGKFFGCPLFAYHRLHATGCAYSLHGRGRCT